MKKLIPLFLLVFVAAACASSQKEENKKLYIEEGEYSAELEAGAQNERRGAKPVVESNYFFRVLPSDTFFYDEKNMPLNEELKTAGDYKAERLWKRPKRYMPGQYPGHNAGTGGEDYSTESQWSYD